MGAEDDGVCLAQLLDEVTDFDNLEGIQPYGGFVQNDDLGVSQQGLGNADR